MEDILKAPLISNAIGRWVKVSNRGIFDADQRNTKEIEQHRAQVRLAVRSLLDRWSESGILDGAPKDGQTMGDMAEMIARAELSKAERVLLREPYAMQHLADTLPDVMRSRQDMLRQRLQRMPSKASKQEILRRELAPK
jgi:cytochrome oxidase assembly protein ShyY1